MEIQDMMDQAHKTAVENGWWDKEREFGTQIGLMHSELSEALEEWRVHGFDPTHYIYFLDSIKKPEGIAVEFADVLIRIFDTCKMYNIPLVDALQIKMKYNDGRSYRHGNKLA